jgi:hypothetical protein
VSLPSIRHAVYFRLSAFAVVSLVVWSGYCLFVLGVAALHLLLRFWTQVPLKCAVLPMVLVPCLYHCRRRLALDQNVHHWYRFAFFDASFSVLDLVPSPQFCHFV